MILSLKWNQTFIKKYSFALKKVDSSMPEFNSRETKEFAILIWPKKINLWRKKQIKINEYSKSNDFQGILQHLNPIEIIHLDTNEFWKIVD